MQEFCLGLDLCPEYSQLSYFDEEKKEPESIYQRNSKETYMLPNVVFYSEESNQWYVGSEASNHRFKEKGMLFENLLNYLSSSEVVTVGQEMFTYQQLFILMLKGHIEDFLSQFQHARIRKLVVTVTEYNQVLFESLEGLAQELSLSKFQFEITSHSNSYLHYVFHQSPDIRNNSVGLFDFGTNGLQYYRIDISRRGKPAVLDIVHKNYGEDIPYDKIFGNHKELDTRFLQIVQKEMQETYISAVYLTGVGFVEKWANQSLQALCSGRRVFMGQNIYTKGACYAAYSGSSLIEEDYIIRSEDVILFDIGVYKGEGDKQFVPIALGGTEWYNMKGKLFVFLDDTNRVELVYRDRIRNEVTKEIVEIHGLPKRPNKTTKLSLSVEFYNEQEGAVIIKDEGFGKLYPTTNKIYRKEFTVEKEA